jgi:hypothetical protein
MALGAFQLHGLAVRLIRKYFNTAKLEYMEQYGSALVTNMYLRVAVLCLSLWSIGALVLNFRTYSIFKNFKPLVIRINEVSRAEPSNTRPSNTGPGAGD